MNWKNRQYATHRRDFDRAALRVEGEPPPVEADDARRASAGSIWRRGPNGEDLNALKAHGRSSTQSRMENPDLEVPAGQRARYEAAFAKFSCDLSRHVLRARARPLLSGRLGRQRPPAERRLPQRDGLHPRRRAAQRAAAGREGPERAGSALGSSSSSSPTTPRAPTSSSSSTRAARCSATAASRARFRPADKDITAEAVILDFKKPFLAKAAADAKNNPIAFEAIADHFDRVNATIRGIERKRLEAEPRHLDALMTFAARAYRRPLSPAERDDLRGVLPLAAREEQPDARRGDARLDRQRADVAALLLSRRPAGRRSRAPRRRARRDVADRTRCLITRWPAG